MKTFIFPAFCSNQVCDEILKNLSLFKQLLEADGFGVTHLAVVLEVLDDECVRDDPRADALYTAFMSTFSRNFPRAILLASGIFGFGTPPCATFLVSPGIAPLGTCFHPRGLILNFQP